MQGHLWKIIAASYVSKNAAISPVSFRHVFKNSTKKLSIFLKVLPGYFNKSFFIIQIH